MTFDPLALTVSIVALIVSIALVRSGWKRDQRARSAESKGRMVQHLIEMMAAESAPLLDPAWDGQRAMEGAECHVRALAVNASLHPDVRVSKMLKSVATHAYALGAESRAYRKSPESIEDADGNRYGARRAALLHVRMLMAEDLVGWLEGAIAEKNIKSFDYHYCDALLYQIRLPEPR